MVTRFELFEIKLAVHVHVLDLYDHLQEHDDNMTMICKIWWRQAKCLQDYGDAMTIGWKNIVAA